VGGPLGRCGRVRWRWAGTRPPVRTPLHATTKAQLRRARDFEHRHVAHPVDGDTPRPADRLLVVADCRQGHKAEFVSYRVKNIDTVLGQVAVRRAY
jgi:hypothetical protein